MLFALAWARALRGRAIDEVCERWNALSATPGHLAVSPERVAGQRHVWRGELDQARVVFERLLTRSDERGEVISYIWARLHICELALRVGDWQTAQRLLDEWEETAEREFFVEPYHKRCRALLAAGRGLPDEALRWSADTIGRAEAIDFQWDWLEGLRARGIVALLVGEPVHAVQSLRLAWEHITREGVDEPGVFPVAPDLVEALVELGEVDQAHAVTSRLQVLAEQQGPPVGSSPHSETMQRAAEMGCGPALARAGRQDLRRDWFHRMGRPRSLRDRSHWRPPSWQSRRADLNRAARRRARR